ncbi:MAG: 3-oxoacyl-[acyl-carrier protein] reductase [Cryomorphaceae bacterium]|jgi:3-oxoacyl-[acyl-carrier protein] reductase
MNRVLLITGASKGIGLATASRFNDAGYKVVNLSRSSCDIQGVSNLSIDLLDKDWPAQHSASILQAVGEPEQVVLVHNAAMMTKETVATLQAQVLRDVLELNVIASAQLNTMLLPLMKHDSSIIYISSTLGTKAVTNTHAYVVSKHAVIGQMRATCQDLAGSMIHTAAICPGFTETEMLSDHLGANPEIYAQITAGIAHRRLAQPSEIAETIWFCSQNPVVNGSVLHANLGQIES